jgi:hypothetical protein
LEHVNRGALAVIERGWTLKVSRHSNTIKGAVVARLGPIGRDIGPGGENLQAPGVMALKRAFLVPIITSTTTGALGLGQPTICSGHDAPLARNLLCYT